MIWPILEARAELQKYFSSVFVSNENSEINWPLATGFGSYFHEEGINSSPNDVPLDL